MRAMRMVIVPVVVALTAWTPAGVHGHATAAGDVVDEGWLWKIPQGRGMGLQGVRFRDTTEWYESVSALRGYDRSNDQLMRSCQSPTDANCSQASRFEFSASLARCASDTELDCIVDFGTVDSSGKRTPATYDQPFPRKGLNDYPADPASGLPRGSTGGLWTISSSTGARVTKHYVRAVVSGRGTPGGQMSFTKFSANITPVSVISIPCTGESTECTPGDHPNSTWSGNHGVAGGWGYSYGFAAVQGYDCVMEGNPTPASRQVECAERKNLPLDVTYYLSVMVSQVVSGWMHGRMSDPTISIEPVAGKAGASTITVQARGVRVPAVVLAKKFGDLPTNLQDKYRATGGWPLASGGHEAASDFAEDEDPSDPLKRQRMSLSSPFGVDAMDELLAWMPVVNDTSLADISMWSVRTLGANDLGAAKDCLSGDTKLAGIVTTNATQYKAGTPEYDSATKTLNYQVAAPHYMSSGEVFKGAYSLVIRSDVARCIYKFSSAPIRATIEVVDTGADKSTVVTNMSENNGWLKLSATGFTHSAPTIRTSLVQEETQVTAKSDVTAGKSITRTQLLKKAGLKATSQSKVTLTVASSSRKVCRVSGASIRATARGTCSLTVTVRTGSKSSRKTVRLTVG